MYHIINTKRYDKDNAMQWCILPWSQRYVRSSSNTNTPKCKKNLKKHYPQMGSDSTVTSFCSWWLQTASIIAAVCGL